MESVMSELEAGLAAARAGAKDQARACFMRVLQADPQNETTWLELSRVMPTTEKALRCIEHLLTINPQHAEAKEVREVLRIRLLLEEVAVFKEQAAPPPPSTPQRRALLGELLLELGILTPQQLDQALTEQTRLTRKKRQSVRLGEVLVQRKLVRRAGLEAVLAIQIEAATPAVQGQQGRTVPLGEFLVQRGLVTRAQLLYSLRQQAALQQQGTTLRFGEVLVRLGYLPQAHLHQAILTWHYTYNTLPVD